MQGWCSHHPLLEWDGRRPGATAVVVSCLRGLARAQAVHGVGRRRCGGRRGDGGGEAAAANAKAAAPADPCRRDLAQSQSVSRVEPITL